MKKTTQILFFGLLIILATSLISGTSVNVNNNICLKDCLSQKTTNDKICLINFNKDLTECSKQYNNCLPYARTVNLNKFSKIMSCQQSYDLCKKGVLNLKNTCDKNTTLNYQKCIESCKNQECTSEYKPVCGKLNIVCFKAPCPEIQKTFSNLCEMKKQGAIFLYNRECKTKILSVYK